METLVLAVEVVMEELGKTWDDMVVELTVGGDTAGEDIMEDCTVGGDILEEMWTELIMAVVESGARSESSSAWVDTTLSSESEE